MTSCLKFLDGESWEQLRASKSLVCLCFCMYVCMYVCVSFSEQEAGGGGTAERASVRAPGAGVAVTQPGVLHLPSAAVCVGILPGLGAYSGSSDSESSSDSEGSVDGMTSPIKRHRLFR